MNPATANTRATTAALTNAPPALPSPPAPAERGTAFIKDTVLAWTTGVSLRDGKTTLGGSPWAVTTLPRRVRPFAQKLFIAGRTGLTARGKTEVDAAIYLLDLSIIHI